ncbi:hypothetical protein AVEN_253817-1 [Araneus ventricosus]|uniref:Uncharacterized protein n=1 Tax=Araneus ventricosus TaxID=182803 RepID=A0A4Y2T4K2_ARAVE|nr:hypothetical protein AVEN_253817-1 [Araneus ventricosus]
MASVQENDKELHSLLEAADSGLQLKPMSFSQWLEAFPMVNQTAETVAATFFAGCVERFGVPGIITTVQGR